MQFSVAELFFKMCNRNLKGSLWGRYICAPLGSTNMAAGNNANIWLQYRHKFDQVVYCERANYST